VEGPRAHATGCPQTGAGGRDPAAVQGPPGQLRITADLREAGWKVSKNTVAAIMREQGLAARRKKKRRATTRPGRGRWRAPDLVKRDFPARQVNRKWYGDGTEIPAGQGKLYLASVMDMASRRVLGFALGEHHDAQLACSALVMAVAVRGGQVPGVIMHTDYAELGVKPGNCGLALSGRGLLTGSSA
jgi:putative transposase